MEDVEGPTSEGGGELGVRAVVVVFVPVSGAAAVEGKTCTPPIGRLGPLPVPVGYIITIKPITLMEERHIVSSCLK